MFPVIIISGPSGSGKSSTIWNLLKRDNNPCPLRLSVSATTRSPRPGEIEGIHYYFWTKQRFQEAINHQEMLEHALVHQLDYYGTPITEVEPYRHQGVGVILDIDVQGMEQVIQKYPDALTIFITAPDLQKRLFDRGESEESIRRRLETAQKEYQYIHRYQEKINNICLEDTVNQLQSIIKHRLQMIPKEKSCVR